MLEHLNAVRRRPGRVLILGTRGFLSTHLQAWCARNQIACRALSSQEIDLTRAAAAAALGKLLRPGDALVMASSIPPDKGRDQRALMANLRMAESVIGALERSPCAQFVYLSSDAVYDARRTPLDEHSSCEPGDLYALSHLAREMLFCAELRRLRIPLCVLRLTAIYGHGDTHNAYGPNRFVRSALSEGRIVLFGKGEEKRSHVYVDDAIEIIGRVLRMRSQGTLNVAVRQAVTFRALAEIVSRLVGRKVAIRYAQRSVPVLHRTHLNSAVFAAFPKFRFTPLQEGLALFIAAEGEGKARHRSAGSAARRS